jgi:N-acyl-D-amino-acid deacylase
MSLLIKGGEVVDGSGSAPNKCDVLVVGGRIAALGDLATYKASRVIQAAGKQVLPGFIDVSSVSDIRLSLFSEPRQADYLKQGVTTIICGSEGRSLSPAMYAGEIGSSNAGWHTGEEYLDAIHSLRPGVNFAGFTGYESIRRSVASRSRNLGTKEIGVFSHILNSQLNDGMVGVSVGNGGFSEFDASKNEIEVVIKALHGENKTAITSLTAKDKPYEVLAEKGIKTIALSLNSSVKTSEAFKKFLINIDKKNLKADFVTAFSPYPYFEVKASELIPFSVLKENESIMENLGKKRFFGLFSKKIKELNPRETFIFDTPKKEARFLLGKSVAEFADNRGVSREEAFARIIDFCGYDTVFLSRMTETSLVDDFALYSKSVIAGGIWSPMSKISHIHSELSDPFVEFFRIANRVGMRLELAVKKLATPFKLIGLKKRGLISEGYAADITIMKNGRPETVLVNGKIAYDNGSVLETRSGEALSV